MSKEIILYNLAEHVTDEQYAQYTKEKKGPLLMKLPSIKKFTLVRITGSLKGVIPYKYMGITDVTSHEEYARDTSTPEFGAFLQEWTAMVSEFHILSGDEVFEGEK